MAPWFTAHPRAAFFVCIPRRVADYYLAAWSDTSQRFRKGGMIVFGVMKGRIEDRNIKFVIPERKVSTFSLKSWKEVRNSDKKMLRGAETVEIVCEQINRNGLETFQGQAVT